MDVCVCVCVHTRMYLHATKKIKTEPKKPSQRIHMLLVINTFLSVTLGNVRLAEILEPQKFPATTSDISSIS